MKIIGFDFGTTNSIISFANPESHSLDCFKYDVMSNEYIPTVVSYNKNNLDDISIGSDAKQYILKNSCETYENFKLRLGKTSDVTIEGKSKSPIEVTADFISKLLEAYINKQNIDEINGIVMTVPETWFREAENRTARDNIEKIFEKLGYNTETQIQLESEPVAASAYFCYAYENSNKLKYSGFLTVIDYGGGTLDVTLCEVINGENIKILERCGFGEYNQTNGCAGVAFDESVIEKLLNDNHMNVKRGDKKFIRLKNDFETAKILNTDKIKSKMEKYYIDPDIVDGEVLFSLDYDDDTEINVYCEDLDNCFKKINAEILENSLRQMQQYFSAHHVNSNSQEGFKILLVGGFSNFYCVEETVRTFFGGMAGLADKRFDYPFPIKNRSLAIAQGAALIAQKVVSVDHVCTHSIGYIAVARRQDDKWEDKFITIVEKGTKISDVKDAKFTDAKVKIYSKKGGFRMFMDDGRSNDSGLTKATLDHSIAELFPDSDKEDNEYQIGFSVNRNLIPTVHIKDKYGKETKTSLNKLLQDLAVRVME